MKLLKTFYGKTVIDSSDSEEIEKNHKIELEYYQTENDATRKPYGIEIVKKNIEDSQIYIESKTINEICDKEQKNNNLLKVLMNNKVTPVSLEDVLQDLTMF